MRSSLLVRGITATAAVLLLTACGGGSEDESASPTTSASPTSAAETTSEAPAGAGSEFCAEAEDFGNRVSESLTGTEDPAQAEAQIRQAAEDIRAIEPPAEIADDWAALADGFDRIADTVAGASRTDDPEAAAQFAADLRTLQESATNVQTYLQDQCGIDTGTTTSESAAPSS